ncbi:hypothetical protein HJA90_10335 [Rhizobium bangladeshense]|uniref:hypothetical protein n=1 Tax=Rhizobium bangladeshense TaxID=1138189 RepID=UPI001C8289EA|nr:hypothetical protein [Rhizobium bangladeshense]MBX4883979.1 hypothetical protein [Rhizobium bangladeshense]
MIEAAKKIENGGPAFPVPHFQDSVDGMSLRDWFAGKALPICIQQLGEIDEADFDQLGRIHGISGKVVIADLAARMAYAHADAMIVIRRGGAP